MNLKKIMPIGLFAKCKSVDSLSRRVQPLESFSQTTVRFFIFLVFMLHLNSCVEKPVKPPTQLEKVRQTGELKIVTRHSPSSYYEGPDGFAGLEHDLAQLFAKRLGVKVSFIVPDAGHHASDYIADKEADIAATGLMVSETRKEALRFAPAYRRITEQVIYRSDRPKPHSVSELSSGNLEVAAGASHVDTLNSLKTDYPDLSWSLNYEQNTQGMLFLVNEGLLDYTIVQSDQMLRMRQFYPKIDVAFDIGEPCDLAWAFSNDEDSSLYNEAVKFFDEIKQNKQLDQLIDRYYGHSETYDASLDSAIRLHYRKRLPKYKHTFQKAGKDQGLDWRLLAALAYQESQWDGNAVSAEGVRGLMMLTGVTARELNVTDPFDPVQSIRGGASYLREAKAQIPAHISEPDRTWFALAAYNVGHGHVEDARHLVRQRGGDPDKWIEVKQMLGLLDKRYWYRQTRHGQARGALAVHYVNSIRRYYDLMVWLDVEENASHELAMNPAPVKQNGSS